MDAEARLDRAGTLTRDVVTGPGASLDAVVDDAVALLQQLLPEQPTKEGASFCVWYRFGARGRTGKAMGFVRPLEHGGLVSAIVAVVAVVVAAVGWAVGF